MRKLTKSLLLASALLGVTGSLMAQDSGLQPADIVNDEGGLASIVGEMAYSNPNLVDAVGSPILLLEDQGGFVTRDRGFVFPLSSQVLGRFTSDFATSPVEYVVTLPQEPQGTVHDVDNDGEDDTGVQIYQVAFWDNIFGDPYLEQRDLGGGGWSSSYSTARPSPDARNADELIGGRMIIYSPDDQQGFPSGFGEDGLLFTEDDPAVLVPAGWTLVDMDTEPFTFDRSRTASADLLEPPAAALDDFSGDNYVDAFTGLVELARNEYAFTEYKDVDWDAIVEEFLPLFEAAEEAGDADAFAYAMEQVALAIPDGHVAIFPGSQQGAVEFQEGTAGGIGAAIRDTDDGTIRVYFLTAGGPAEEAGIEIGAEIIEINGLPATEAVDAARTFQNFSSPENARYQALRYVFRAPLDTEFEITYQNPDGEPETVTLTTVGERDSFGISSVFRGVTGLEQPIEFSILPSGYGYVKIYDFSAKPNYLVLVWEQILRTMNNNGIPGLVIDLRQNPGGFGYFAALLSGYLYEEEVIGGYDAEYNEEVGGFFTQTDYPTRLIPPDANSGLIYSGAVTVLVGPGCFSTCEYMAYYATLGDRAPAVGYYGTAGLGGGYYDIALPDGQSFALPTSRPVDENDNIIIEGTGVLPDIRVPVTVEGLVNDAAGGDTVLDAAVAYLDEVNGFGAVELDLVDSGNIVVGDVVEGDIAVGQRRQYALTAEADVVLNIALGDADGALDTYLRVYDADTEELIAESDDIELGVNINSLVEGLEVTGGQTIVIEVGTYDDGSEGAFTLEVSAAE